MGRPLLLVEPLSSADLLDLSGTRYIAWIAKATGCPQSLVRSRLQVAHLGQRAGDVEEVPTAFILAGRKVAEALGLGALVDFRPLISNAGVSAWRPAPTYLIPTPSDLEPWWDNADNRERGLVFLRCVIDPKRAENRDAAAKVIEIARN